MGGKEGWDGLERKWKSDTYERAEEPRPEMVLDTLNSVCTWERTIEGAD